MLWKSLKKLFGKWTGKKFLSLLILSPEFIGILSYFILWLVAGTTDSKKSGKGEEEVFL